VAGEGVAGRGLSPALEKQFFVRRGQELWSAAINRAFPVQRGSLDELIEGLEPVPESRPSKACKNRK